MTAPPASPPAAPPPPGPRRGRRIALWALLVSLLFVAQSLLVVLTRDHENGRVQEATDAASQDAAAELRLRIAQHQQQLVGLSWGDADRSWKSLADELLRTHPELLRVERRDAQRRIVEAADTPFGPAPFSRLPRADQDFDADAACRAAQRSAAPVLSRSYFMPFASGQGTEVADLCVPQRANGAEGGFAVATISLTRLLEILAGEARFRGHELSFVEGDGTRLARAGQRRGAGAFVSERLVDLPGSTLQLRLDSSAQRPGLIPTLPVALVMGLSLLLFAVVALLVRDGRRRAAAEERLAEALAFRRAMEDSLVTGLRASDLAGRITYANPAFCQMVGWSIDEMIVAPVPPYWPPDAAAEYSARQAERHRAGGTDPRTGFETAFVRRSGERFPVLVFEAPLVDARGTQTGWMSAVLDVSEQRRVEEMSRQQQERLAATARLASMGEMASLLGHELNQPLAAIASYATGSLNLLADPGEGGAPDAHTLAMLKQATQRIAEQAERAGRVIKSVHDFVRRREQPREALGARLLLDAVLPLVRLQARKSGAQIVVEVPDEPTPRVLCDRTMVEQVLLNLTRNGLQAMADTPPNERLLTLRVTQQHPRWVAFDVIDRGTGIPPDVAKQLFTPFFTTREEGMGLGLSLCRTVVEQHGGALDFENLQPGTRFRFTLPAAQAATPRPPVSDPAIPATP
jgi:two-component system sensor histidine kinase DctS